MRYGYSIVFVLLFLMILISAFHSSFADTASLITDIQALDAYDSGFAENVMRSSDGRGVMLNDMVLYEDDGPGAGNSEKGTWQEEIYHGVLARKTFILGDTRAFDAYLVMYMEPLDPDRESQKPFYILLNGIRIEGPPLSWHENMWHWVRIPVDALNKGENSVVIGCDADPGRGYMLMIARADEYEAGGGTYISGDAMAFSNAGQLEYEMDEKSGTIRFLSIGKNSSKSVDNGSTWERMKLGRTKDVVGEYTIRLNLKRYVQDGSLMSAPVDLWDGVKNCHKLKPSAEIERMKIYCLGDCPEGTSIRWKVRFADTPDIMSDEWMDFRDLGVGESVTVDISSSESGRYLQWRAELLSDDPLATPVVQSVRVLRDLSYAEMASPIYIREYDNVSHRYPSVPFSYEKWDEPKLRILRERLKLDDVIEGAVSDWDIINRVRHHVSRQWHHGSPIPGYPEWNALDILDRRDRTGKGGMCIQFSVVFIQSLASLGYQARHINMFAHETVEVYVDELGRWVHVDPESVFDSYEYNTETGMPINCLEQHKWFLRECGRTSENPIDWQATEPWAVWGGRGMVVGADVPLDFSTNTGWINDPEKEDYPPQHRLAGFLRMMPRNDYFSRPWPRPLSQGASNWPWNGYINWYDEATPRKMQYSHHSDRKADFYPTLNRVEFDCVRTGEDEIGVSMITFAPNFDGFEVNIDNTGWRLSPSGFVWKIKRSASNRLEMRVKNKLGPKGKASVIELLHHHKEPYTPRPDDW